MMNIKKLNERFVLMLLGLLTLQVAFSQDNYVKGYIIDNNQNRIEGFINYGNWEHNPNKVEFKKGHNSKPIVYTPIEIAEFRVLDEIYVSGIVEAETTAVLTDKLEEDPTMNITIDTVFLQTLIRGAKSLFYYNSSEDRPNFYIEREGKYELLLHKRYITRVAINQYLKENKKYLGQLTAYLRDCKSITSQMKDLPYKRKALMGLFKYYYKCAPQGKYFEKKMEKTRVELGALGGLSISSVNFSSSRFLHLVRGKYGPSINPSLGLFLDLIIPRNNGRLSINNEVLVTMLNATNQYDDIENEEVYTKNDTEIAYSYLKMNNMVRYRYFIQDNMALYINAGMTNGFVISEKNTNKIESKFYSTERVFEEPAIEETRKYEQGWLIGTGIKYNKLSGEIRYERGSGMSGIQVLSSTIHRFYVLFGYKF